ILFALITVPVYLHYMGEERYGVLVLVWLISGFLLFFDFGLGQSIRYELSRREKAPQEEKVAVFWTALILSAGLGLAGAVAVCFLANFAFGSLVAMPAEVRTEVLGSLPWIGVLVAVATLDGV